MPAAASDLDRFLHHAKRNYPDRGQSYRLRKPSEAKRRKQRMTPKPRF